MLTADNDLPGNGVRKKAANLSWQETVKNIINSNLDTLARRTMQLHMERNPELDKTYNERSRAYYIEDSRSTLEALASAIILDTPDAFAEYVTWLVSLLKARKIPTGGLPLHFACMRDGLHEVLSENLAQRVDIYLNAGVVRLSTPTNS